MGTTPPLPARLRAAARQPLVGRVAELGILEEAWEATLGGARQVVFVGGEPGAGKTRLAAEVGTVLAEHGATVLLGSCARDVGVPYQPFVELLDQVFEHDLADVLGDLPEDRARALAHLSPRLAADLQVDLDEAPSSAGHRRRLFEATAGLLATLADARPLVLVLDDLHWAQAPTLALLDHVVSSVVDARLLVLGAFRTTDPDRSDDLSRAIADLYRLTGVRRIDLAGLDTDDITDYLVRQGGATTEVAKRSAPMLRDQTGGNPFFLVQLWRDLGQQTDGLGALRSGRLAAPRSIGATLERRLTGLSPLVRGIIEVAAVAGDVFDPATVAAAAEVEPARALAAMDAATAVGLIEPTGSRRHGFVHALSRQTVLDRLPSLRTAELHARMATVLEARRDEPAVVPRLAHHYLACQVLGYEEEAVTHAVLAGTHAERSLAFEEAAAWYERAAAVPGTPERGRLRLAAASNHVRSGAFARAREIAESLRSSRDPEVRLAAAITYEDASWRPGRQDSSAADLLTEALATGNWKGDESNYVLALASLGRALTFAGDDVTARRVGDRSIELAGRLDDDALVSHARSTSLWHGLAPENATDQLRRAAEVAEHAWASGNLDLVESASYFRAMAAYVLGEPLDLEVAVHDFHAATAASSGPFERYVGGCLEFGRSFLRGDFAEARRVAEEAIELGRVFGSDDPEGSYGLQMFMLQRETGGLESVRPHVDGNESFAGRWVPGLLALYTELGMTAGMVRALPRSLAAMDERRAGGAQWPAELAFTTESALALEDHETLERLLPLVQRYRGLNLVTGEFVATFGAADRYLARMAALAGDHDRAEELFVAALALDEATGSVVHAAETLLHHGLHLLANGEDAQGWRKLDRARELAEPIGQQRVLAALPSRTGDDLPDGLSEREVEVLRLLAEGLSNREIGDRLYISGHTAANHVRSILMKTGAANRTQAAMYAAAQDLLGR